MSKRKVPLVGRVGRSPLGGALAACAAGMLSSCAGGAGQALPGARASTAPSTPPAATARLVIGIVIPPARKPAAAARRRPQYVSSATQSASVAIDGGAPLVVNLTPSSTNCSPTADGARECTLAVAAPVGADTLSETLYAGLDATGAILSQGTTSATIVAGQVNTVLLTLDGVIASLTLALSDATPPLGTPNQRIGLTVNFNDAGGAAIIGKSPFATPVTLTDSDISGITSLSKSVLDSPADAAALTIAYTGAPLAQAIIGGSAGNIVAASVTLTPRAPLAPSPAPSATPAFNDYVTFGFDNGRDVYNPNSTSITPASLPSLHLAWQAAIGGGDYNTQTQPILATEIGGHAGVLYVGGGSGNVYAYDALTGNRLWTRATGQETYTCENNATFSFGVGGTAAYDPASKSLYIVGNTNAAPNAAANNSLYHLDGASGAVLGAVDFAPPDAGWPSLDFSHTAVTLSNGRAYVGTGATCDISSWRGRVVAVAVPAMTIANTYFPVWKPPAQPWGGGGIWGWGGVSLDPTGDVLTGIGNTDDGSTTHGAIVAPFSPAPHEYSGAGDAFVKLSADLTTQQALHHPLPVGIFSGMSIDLDLSGTPTVFTPNGAGCDPLAALQGKSGALYIYDVANVGGGPVGQYQLAPSTYADGFLGGPAYSPATGLLYTQISSSNQSMRAPGMIAIDPACGNPSVAWTAAFGPDSYSSGSLSSPGVPRSVPAVSAGGVVFAGTMCAPAGGTCAATASVSRRAPAAIRKPLICCTPAGSGGGALWALDAATGTVLNGGNPLIVTSGPLRVPPTIDGDWIFVLDNAGNLYALTIDPAFAATRAKGRAIDARNLKVWEPAPTP